uniref:Uncharacterized protein n=1 Tax=Sphenodon punctatus TaxID=8508 RepID=A0A8D0H9E0_SPHPU
MPGTDEAELSLAAPNCLINSCVCCGSCEDNREDVDGLKNRQSPGKIINASYSLVKSKEKDPLDKLDGTASAQEALKPETSALLAEIDSGREEQKLSNSSKCLACSSGSPAGAEHKSQGDQQEKCEKRRQRQENLLDYDEESGSEMTAKEDTKSRSSSSSQDCSTSRDSPLSSISSSDYECVSVTTCSLSSIDTLR